MGSDPEESLQVADQVRLVDVPQIHIPFVAEQNGYLLLQEKNFHFVVSESAKLLTFVGVDP